MDSHGFDGGYQSVRRFVTTLRESMAPEARAIIETPPGEECQVDYGTGPKVRDPVTGQVSAYAAVCADAGLQPQVGPITGVPVQYANLGRAA